MIGEYKNNGQEWTPIKNPIEVNVYDFIDKTNGKANLDEKTYKTGIKITEQEKQSLNIERIDFHGEWNYRISPNL